MTKILLTAFEPFGRWRQNSSALCASALKGRRGLPVNLVTKIYPVDFARAQKSVNRDLLQEFDFAIHMGQHEMSSGIRLERTARNIRPAGDDWVKPLVRNGPPKLRTGLPLQRWNRLLKKEGIPSIVSFDAGNYLCNAVFYWSLYYSKQNSLSTQSLFIHLPLAKPQVLRSFEHLPSLETEVCANAIEIIIGALVRQEKAPAATRIASPHMWPAKSAKSA
jgi:pyroglutamyl-peptidase